MSQMQSIPQMNQPQMQSMPQINQQSLMFGDSIKDLPTNNQATPKQSDLEMIYNLFNDPSQVDNTNKIVKSTFDTFKLSIVAGILFAIFSMTFTSELFKNYFKNSNQIVIKLITIGIFMLVFFVIQKILKL